MFVTFSSCLYSFSKARMEQVMEPGLPGAWKTPSVRGGTSVGKPDMKSFES